MIKSFIPACAIVLALAMAAPSSAQIKREVDRDGTVRFFNPGEAGEPERRPVAFASAHNPLIERISREQGMDPDLIKCIVKVESDFNPEAVSYAGAMGLMQLMPEVARSYGVTDAFDPEQNLTAGIRHFKYLMGALNNDVTLSLAAYHAGLGRVKQYRYTVPPIQSTIDYVKVVTRYYYLSGPPDLGERITRLYTRIREDGTIEIFGR